MQGSAVACHRAGGIGGAPRPAAKDNSGFSGIKPLTLSLRPRLGTGFERDAEAVPSSDPIELEGAGGLTKQPRNDFNG